MKEKSGLIDKHQQKLICFILLSERKMIFLKSSPIEIDQQNTDVAQEKEEILAHRGLSL